jgi:hypothetical protein
MRAVLVFVKAEEGEYHHVWIEPDCGASVRFRLHVVHDLPHLAVESTLKLDDGLWGSLVASGRYPGLTEGHLAAKALTNAVSSVALHGPPTVDGLRQHLESFHQAGRSQRASHKDNLEARVADRVAMLLAAVDDQTVETALAERQRVFDRWNSTPIGDVMRLQWPLADQPA